MYLAQHELESLNFIIIIVIMVLQNLEAYEEDVSGIQVSAQTSSLKYGLWVNTTKNPRLKTLEFSQLGISIEVD